MSALETQGLWSTSLARFAATDTWFHAITGILHNAAKPATTAASTCPPCQPRQQRQQRPPAHRAPRARLSKSRHKPQVVPAEQEAANKIELEADAH